MLIREIQENEVSQVKNLINFTITSCYPMIYALQVVDYFIDHHSEEDILERSRKGTVLVGYSDGAICSTGFLVGEELGGVYIHPYWQRKGYGAKMVDELLILANNCKLKKVWLYSTPLARQLYLSKGFFVVEERRMFVKDHTPLDYFYMEKGLAETN